MQLVSLFPPLPPPEGIVGIGDDVAVGVGAYVAVGVGIGIVELSMQSQSGNNSLLNQSYIV